MENQLNGWIENYNARVIAGIDRDRKRSRWLNALALPGIIVLFTASLALSIYWMVFNSGLVVMAPGIHKHMVSIAYMYPGQSEHVQKLLTKQGFLSLWQIRDISKSANESN